jgi:hypothetical protein
MNAAQAPRVVALTMTRDEAGMLPRWLEYYGGQLGNENLVVLDDNSVDGSTDHLPCPRLRLPPEPWTSPWAQARLALVNGLSRGLLACYDVVVFTDVDEFLVPDPRRYEGLVDYLTVNRSREVIAPLAVNVLHNPMVEPALDPRQPLLAQRRFVKYAPGMCKPLIKRTAADWWASFHGITAPFEVDRDLLMLHMKFCDVSSLMTVSEHRHARHEEGRGHPTSAWAVSSDELASRLSTWVQTPERHNVPEFDPYELDLSDLVRDKGRGRFRSHGPQLRAMDENDLRRLPERFRMAF